MFDYELSKDKKVYNITLESGKVVKCSTQFIETAMKNLELDLNSAIEIWLDDNNYLENEEQKELDNKAKQNKVKVKADSDKPRKKTTRERKPNPTKEKVIAKLAETLQTFTTDVNIENVGKIITFKLDNKEFKLDLTEKRAKKTEK